MTRPRYFLIVSYGRAGTTLLQGALNKSPQIHCGGERKGFLGHLFRACWALERAREQSGLTSRRDTPLEPFFGVTSLDFAQLNSQFQALFRTVVSGGCPAGKNPEFLGFKDVLYPYEPDLPSMLSWLVRVLDKPIVIVVTRQLDDVLDSGFFGQKSHEERQLLRPQLETFEANVRDFIRRYPYATEVTYEEMVHHPERTVKAISSVGLPLTEPALMDALKVQHGYTPARRNNPTSPRSQE